MKIAAAILGIAWFFAALGVQSRTDLSIGWGEVGLVLLYLPLWGTIVVGAAIVFTIIVVVVGGISWSIAGKRFLGGR